jgi:hypothetical protein
LNYAACPKCGHQPLPAEQAFPAACPGCGVILAKISAAPPPRRRKTDVEPGPFADLFFPVPAQVAKLNWGGRIAILVLFVAWTAFIWRDIDVPAGENGSHFLHSILIPFHEAGHYLIFRWFGEFIMILGGTLGQHLLPIVLGGALLWKRRDAFGAAIFLWLLGFSLVDMAVYMYDAFDPKLMLLTGSTGADSDGHDWQNLFGDLGLLKSARGIGLAFDWIGRAVMVAGLLWAALMVWLQHAKLSDSPFAEIEDLQDSGR